MKSKCTYFLKVTTALVLALLVMVGSMSSVVGAIVETAAPAAGTDVTEVASVGEGADAAASSGDVDIVEPDAVSSVSTDKAEVPVRSKSKSDLADTGTDVDISDTGADTNHTLYFVVPLAWSNAGYDIKIKANLEGNNSWDTGLQTATDTGETYFGYRVYTINLYERWDGWYNMYIYGYQNNTEQDYLCLIASDWQGGNDIYGKCCYTAVSGKTNDWAAYKPDTNFYLSGYLGKYGTTSADTGFQSTDFEMTRGTGANSRKWTYQYRVNGDQYITVNMKNDFDARVLHPTSDNAGSGTACGAPDQATGGWKWKVTAASGKIVNLTYDTSTRKLTWTLSDPSFYLFGGEQRELNNTTHLADFTYNSTTGLYDTTYTFSNTNWTSFLISTSSTSVNKEWTSYGEVGWNLDTYGSTVYRGYSSSHREPSSGEMSSGALNYVEINDYSGYHGLKVGAKHANTTVNLSYNPANKILYIWGGEVTAATVYAKDGAIRSESVGDTYANIADTQIVASPSSTTSIGTDHSGSVSGQTYETYKADKGQTIYIRTTINETVGTGNGGITNRAKYYVRGFCVNGVVSEVYTWNSSGVYTMEYTINEDYDGEYIEITPIYYLKDTSSNPIVTFRVQDFPKGKYNWGDTLYCYPFYGTLSSNNNAFGAYPGQPIVYYNGQYSIQIPQNSTAWNIWTSDDKIPSASQGDAAAAYVAGTHVSGITMSNGYYDSVHRTIMGYGGNGASADHVQTYDYGDFYKIFNEKKPVDNIVYDFKYKSTKHNFEDQISGSTTASALDTKYGSGGNGFELLKNFHGKNVDLFGTPLSGTAATPNASTNPPVYVVSIGGVDGDGGVENVAGWYATEWIVYAPTSDGSSYTRVSVGSGSSLKNSIPPEVLVLNDDDNESFNATTYPSADENCSITDWKALYTALEAYRGKPVYISYEAADAQIGSGNYATSGGGGATRNDGRWLYSKTGESITSNIKIQVSQDNGNTYYDNGSSSLTYPSGDSEISGLSAFFTNSEVSEGATTFSTTIDPDKTFNFDAETTNANYMFVGWYMDDTNNTLITTDNEGSTERSGSYTFIAKFKQVTEGQLVLQHSKATGGGEGTTLISAVVKNSEDETVQTYADAATITIPSKYIRSTNTGYTVEVTLKATPSGYDTYNTTNLANADSTITAAKFFNNPSTTTSDRTTIKTFSFTIGQLYSGTTQLVNSLLYQSSFTKTEFTYNFTFSYRGRLGDSNQSYTRAGTLTAAQVKDYVTGSAGNYTLSANFIRTLAPHESNFNETLIWSISDKTISSGTAFTETYNAVVYTANPEIEGEKLRSTARTVTFALPYAHTDGVPSLAKPDIGGSVVSSNLSISLNYGDLIKYNNNYITAPETVNNLNSSAEDNTEYFQYWNIYEQDNGVKGQFVTRCYSDQFNYTAYDSYYIEPVYAAEKINYSEQGASSSISYLDTTRNQWNNNGNGGYKIQAARDKASDILFNDFALSYNYNEYELYLDNNTVNDQTVEVGFIVEKVQKMDLKQDGTYDSDVSKYIVTGEAAATAKTNATAAINGLSVSGNGGVNQGNSSKGYANYTNYKIDRTQLDNKNRIEFYYALYNAYGDSNDDYLFDTKLANKNYVYRAYSYIKVGNELTITDNPVYFIMYDEATK